MRLKRLVLPVLSAHPERLDVSMVKSRRGSGAGVSVRSLDMDRRARQQGFKGGGAMPSADERVGREESPQTHRDTEDSQRSKRTAFSVQPLCLCASVAKLMSSLTSPNAGG